MAVVLLIFSLIVGVNLPSELLPALFEIVLPGFVALIFYASAIWKFLFFRVKQGVAYLLFLVLFRVGMLVNLKALLGGLEIRFPLDYSIGALAIFRFAFMLYPEA